MLPIKFGNSAILLEGKKYAILDQDVLIVNQEGEFAQKRLPHSSYTGWVYEFGGRWYLQNKDEELSLSELKYLGKAVQDIETKAFLGIHSTHELMNGVSQYSDWLKKGLFIGVEALGICEKHSLSGVLDFQKQCLKNGVKPITGLTLKVKGKQLYTFKLYVKDFEGWQNLLKFNKKINVQGQSNVEEKYFLENKDGLFIIVDTKEVDYKYCPKYIDYYQLETVRFSNNDLDKDFLKNLAKYIRSSYSPISITDAYYLEPEDFMARETLWSISKVFDVKSENQHFKTKQEYATELIDMFAEGCDGWKALFKKAVLNENVVVEGCNFIYDTDTRHLPRYKMNDWEKANFKTSEALFMHYIDEGFRDRGLEKKSEYLERLNTEIEVLKTGDVLDYFLSWRDIIKKAKEDGVLVGFGRGSAAGALVAYLLGLVEADPIEFDLMFERFLNSGRMGVWEDRPLFEIEVDNDNIIKLPEGAMVRIKRGAKEMPVFVHDLVEGDEILRY